MSVVPFFVLGLFMPIDFVQSVPPIFFDFLRYGAALWIFLTAFFRRRRPTPSPLLEFVAFLLIASGAISLVKNIIYDGSLFGSAVGLASAIAAYCVVRVGEHHQWLLLGFVWGCALSAFDIILQVVGLPFLGAPSIYGFRYAGFSFGSTAVAPLLAVALCIVLTSWAWNRRNIVLRVLLAMLLISGLISSQGRGGILGLILALILFTFFYMRIKPILTLFLGGGIVGIFVASGGVPAFIEYLSRAGNANMGDITSGRVELNAVAWNAFWTGGLLGIDPSDSNLYNPHMAPLSAALNIGPFGLVSTALICIALAAVAFFFFSSVPLLFRMIASIALVVAFLEPSGFFVGFTGVTLVMLCCFHLETTENPRSESLQ